MSFVSVRTTSDHWWTEVCKKVRKGLVFIDDASAECLHWNGGIGRLIEAGAVNAKEFSAFESGSKTDKKAVFILSTPVHGLTLDTLGEIVRNSHFEYVQVISCAPPTVLNFAKFPGREMDEMAAFQQLEETILGWMGNLNYTCEVFSFPIHTVAIGEEVFVMPPFSRLFPLLESDLVKARTIFRTFNEATKTQVVDSGEYSFDLLPHELQVVMRHFVSALHSMLQTMNIKEDIFTCGKFSRLLGEDLEALPAAKNRRKTASHRASVLLVDRTLDLAGTSSTSFETLMDRILATLPKFPGHANDVQVELASLFGMSEGATEAGALCPGCIAPQQGNDQDDDPVGPLIRLREKDCLQHLHNKLTKGNAKNVSKDMLAAAIAKFKRNVEGIEENVDALQQAMAAVLSLDKSKTTHFSRLAQLQTELLMLLSDPKEAEGALAHLIRTVRMRREQDLKLEDILVLLVYVYALVKPGFEFYPEDQDRLESALSEAILQDKDQLGDVFQHLTHGMKVDEILAFQIVKNIFAKLNSVLQTRSDMKVFNTALVEEGLDFGNLPPAYLSFLKLFFDELYSPDRRQVLDLEHKTGGLGGMIKSGISFLGVNVNKMHPRENPIIFVFIVGGITTSEVKKIREMVSSFKTSSQVIVGSTKLTTPRDLLDTLFVRDPLFVE